MANSTRKKYDHQSARRRSPFMLPACSAGTAGLSITAAMLGLVPAAADVAQDEDRGDGQDREHEEGHRRAERDVVALDAKLERPGGEDVRLVYRPAGSQDPHDVEVGEGDDEREEHRDRDNVAHHR